MHVTGARGTGVIGKAMQTELREHKSWVNGLTSIPARRLESGGAETRADTSRRAGPARGRALSRCGHGTYRTS